jgi:hypothetical protein
MISSDVDVQACPGATDGEEGNLRRQQVSQNKVSTKQRAFS